MAWTLLSSQSTSTITKMSVYTHMEGRHLARPHRTATTNSPCTTPGSILAVSSHRARKVRRVPQTQEGILSVDRRNSFQSGTSSMWQQCLSDNSLKILAPVSDMNPMCNADSGASHVFLPQSALFDSKSAKPVNLRLAAGEIQAVEAHREVFAEHVTIPLCPLGRVIRNCNLLRSGHLRL